MEQLYEKVQKVAALLKNSSYAVILTGSGVSDKKDDANFRSPGRGMWTMLDPDVFTIQRFKENPNAFYEIGAPFFTMLEEMPGEAHKAIAELEKKGLIKAIITNWEELGVAKNWKIYNHPDDLQGGYKEVYQQQALILF